MAVFAPGWITINTDAGYYPWNGLASYAYWIRFEGQLLSGSGIFKERQKGSSYAEEKAVLNALHVVQKQIKSGIVKIIFNLDLKLNANPNTVHGKEIHAVLKTMHQRYIVDVGKSISFEKFFEFRHVKAHNSADNKRTWVNNRLDEMCRTELKNEAVRLALEMRRNRVKIIKKKRS